LSDAPDTHVLSLLFALAIIPIALWAGWSLLGRRAGWCCAVLAACNPLLTYYAQETRMYTLAALLALVATACFVHAFVLRRRRYLVPFAVALILLLYTHNWGLFFAVGTVIATAVCVSVTEDRRKVVVDSVVVFGSVALIYLPWIPTIISATAGNRQVHVT